MTITKAVKNSTHDLFASEEHLRLITGPPHKFEISKIDKNHNLVKVKWDDSQTSYVMLNNNISATPAAVSLLVDDTGHVGRSKRIQVYNHDEFDMRWWRPKIKHAAYKKHLSWRGEDFLIIGVSSHVIVESQGQVTYLYPHHLFGVVDKSIDNPEIVGFSNLYYDMMGEIESNWTPQQIMENFPDYYYGRKSQDQDQDKKKDWIRDIQQFYLLRCR
jgi:hypothetical protein